jgi:(E)-4-hydroxy-3-methylbut-2-enyl-diphosphate synthase
VLSAKVSAVQDLIAVYREVARRSDYAIHLGLTEAGMGSKGIVASSAALGILLQEGIGDTIRFSLTPEPGGDRTLEVKAAQELLQTMGFAPRAARGGLPRLRTHHLDGVPGARPRHPGLDRRLHAGMEADLSGRRGPQRGGDGLHRERPGRVEARRYRHLAPRHRRGPERPVFIDGRKAATLRGPSIAGDFKAMVQDYIERRYRVDTEAAE